MMKIERSVQNVGVDTCKTMKTAAKLQTLQLQMNRSCLCVFSLGCVCGGASKTIKKASNYLERKEPSLFGRMSQVLEFSRETELIYNTYYKVIY